MGVFDQGGRYLIRRRPEAFFARHTPRFLGSFVFRRWWDTALPAFPGEPDRIFDLIAEFVHRSLDSIRRLVDVEVQTEPDPDMFERLGEYAYRLRREVRHGEGQDGKYVVISFL